MSVMASQITSLTIVCSTVYFMHKSKEKSKLRITVVCAGKSRVTGEFPAQSASNAENVSICWRHHEWIGPCNHHSMENPPHNLGELRQALLDKWVVISVERLQHLVASMPRRLAARGGNTRYWPGIHKTTPTGSIMQKCKKFVWPDLPDLPFSDI